MTHTRRRSRIAQLASRWPFAGIALGGLLNVVGLVRNEADLIGTGANVLAFSIWYAGRRSGSG